MIKHLETTALTAAAVLAVASITNPVHAAFLTPGDAGTPFADWSRGDANTTYNEWDIFTDPWHGDEASEGTSIPNNAPDVGSFGPAGAEVRQLAGPELFTDPDFGTFFIGAFITSTSNIYSFNVATEFEVEIPQVGIGGPFDGRIVMQTRTQGTQMDVASVLLNIDGQSFAPDFTEQLLSEPNTGLFGGLNVENLFVWDVSGVDASSATFTFNAAAPSMSLDRLAIDTFAQSAAVPEPATTWLVATSAAAVLLRRRRRAG